MISIQPPPQQRQQSFPIPDQIIHGSKAMIGPERLEQRDFIGEHAAQIGPRIGRQSHLSIPRQRCAGENDTVGNFTVHNGRISLASGGVKAIVERDSGARRLA